MKICLVADNINPKAGLGRMVTSIADGLYARGHGIGYIVSDGFSDHPILKISFRYSYKKIFSLLHNLFKVRSFAKNYDVIVCFDILPAGIIIYLALLGTKTHIVIHALGTYSLFTNAGYLKNKLAKKIYHTADRIFLINTFVKNQIEFSGKDLGFKFKNNINFVPVGVNTASFNKKTPTYKYADEYILSVGAVKPRKGQFESIKAFAKVKDTYPSLKYVIVGSISDAKEYYGEIREYIIHNNLDDRIIFLQNISDDDLIDLYSGANFFIMVPENTGGSIEGFGMVYLEAALCGLVSIGTFGTGAEAAIVNKKTGILVSQGDVEEMSTALDYLQKNITLRNSMAIAAYQYAYTYDWENVLDLYENELSNIILNSN